MVAVHQSAFTLSRDPGITLHSPLSHMLARQHIFHRKAVKYWRRLTEIYTFFFSQTNFFSPLALAFFLYQ